jgi:hypothetical protein
MPAPKDPEAYALWKERLSASHKGKPWHGISDEGRARISAAKKGKPNPHIVGDKNPMKRPEVAEKVAQVHRGVPKSPEQRAKIAATLTGRKHTAASLAKMRTANPGYAAAHARIKTERGLPSQHRCAHCGRGAQDWALIAGKGQSRRGKQRRPSTEFVYSLDPDDYIPLCHRCHMKYDWGK